MATLKVEPSGPPKRQNKRQLREAAQEEPGLLSIVGASFGLCKRALTAEEKAKRVKEFCELVSETEEQASKILESVMYDVPRAMAQWAGMQNAIVLDEDDENLAPTNKKGRSRECDAFDVVHTMNRSSYGRIVKIARRFGTLARVSLPTIVVVGSESAGKSSTLERIAGLNLFPRDVKICTRMPIKLSLITSEDEKSMVTLKFPGRPDVVVSEKDTASKVGELMSEVVPPGKGVIETQLTIEVRKPSVPTLDLVDLPGIVAASIEGEPADMMARTRSISEKYLMDPSTIAVVVVPANITRVRDSQAIQLVQAAKKEALTLGVLAKADLAHDPRYKQRKHRTPYWELQERLAGNTDDMVKLPNGWVAVKNRDTLVEEEEASGMSQSSATERDWFRKEAQLGSDNCGIDALVRKIDLLFTDHIRATYVPQAEAHLKEESEKVALHLEALGQSPSSLTLDEVLSGFTTAFKSGAIASQLNWDALDGATQLVSAAIERVSASIGALRHQSANPTIERVLAKKALNTAIIDSLTRLPFVDASSKALNETFASGTTPPLRLIRFEVLNEKLEDELQDFLIEQEEAFKQQASAAIANYFMTQVGSAYDLDSITPRLSNIIAEVALEVFIAPLILDPKIIAKSLYTQTEKKRKRDCAENPWLEESCAAQRAQLASRQHSIFKALNEIRNI